MGKRGAGAAVACALTVGAIASAVASATTGPGPVASGSRVAERAAGPARRVSVIAGGDILTESRVRTVAAAHGAATGARFDFDPLFAPVRPLIESADVAICHMELPIGAAGGSYGNHGRSPYGGNLLVAPYEIAAAARSVGFDRCSTASNHAYDVGAGGVASTFEALAASGVGSAGTARSVAEAGPVHFTVDGIRMAHVSFTTGSNTVSPAERWRLNLSRDPSVIAGQVARARADGAEIVLLSLHVTHEMLPAPIAADHSLVATVVQAVEVDAVFVHGPHVVQPFGFVGRTPVWWSLGNFVSEMGGPTAAGRYVDPRTGDGLLAVVEFVDMGGGDFYVDARSIAICNEYAARTVRAATVELARPDLPAGLRAEMQACLARTRVVVPDVG
ncbi:poly-gamma-glutamate synthesis protein (capsule biosynthesis protein) [Ilumatobacter fluminis]|uniref:Poly-gamma-glutamate synthesis protein (Capsule biosynthesis protein) n=1 Tax=Ilumatobacter fluminis TaxID=467091 RepID=A0A4R7I5X2_9ACTN|nr:CapA family protein [Ilumatobacter fluminis]TDT18419.1 poly-gamma-glutamate synthesis protein (capsule biosynthesis protein) [Ilumatobacter fluminis]